MSYNEFLPESRFVYEYLKRHGHKSVSIQHSYNSRNKLFSNYKFEKIGTSPSPNLFLVQGDQYKNILSSFYDYRQIVKIGVLKYDKESYWKNNTNEVNSDIINTICKDDKKILLVVFSIDDEDRIIKLLSDFKHSDKWRILISPHPVTVLKTLDLCNKLLKNVDFEYYPEFKTVQLISIADLILGGIQLLFLSR